MRDVETGSRTTSRFDARKDGRTERIGREWLDGLHAPSRCSYSPSALAGASGKI